VKRSHLGAMLLCILFFSCSFAFGQSATTSLRGTIKDPSGALIPGATVTITDKSVDKTLTATSNGEGTYQFLQIPPAHYLITVTAQGLGSQSKTAELLVSQPATIDFKLSIQSSSVTVDVSASAQTLNTTDASMGNSVGNEMIQSLPMDGRDPISLLALQPGVLFLGEGGGNSTTGNPNDASTTDSRQGAVSGSRSDQGNVTLDGLDDNDQLNGFAFTGVLRSTLDSTEEFRVTTSNGTADAGRSSGAQVSLVTKKGTNKYHGAAYEYFRPSNTVSNNWFLKNSQLSSEGPNVSAGFLNIPAKYIKNVFGTSFGGPIIKDKLFFFGNYEGLRQAIDNVASATVPTASFMAGNLQYQDDEGNNQMITRSQVATLDAACTTSTFNGASICPWGPGANPNVVGANGTPGYYSSVPTATGSSLGDGDLNSGSLFFAVKQPTTQNTSIFKLDYNLTSKQQIFARGNLQKDIYAGVSNLPGQPPASNRIDNTKGIAFGHTWTPTSNIVNDFRYGYVRQGYGVSGIGSGEYVFFRFLTQPTAQTRSTIQSVPVHNVIDTLTLTRGNHTITVGGSWRMVQNVSSSDVNSYSGASTNPYWLGGNPPDPSQLGSNVPEVGSSFQNSWIIAYASLLGTVPNATATSNYSISSPTTASLLKEGTFIDRHFKANEFEYYLQDSWRIKPNLTITAGLRHTVLQTPYETNGQEVTPTVDTHTWFQERGWAASKGVISEPNLLFTPAGKANGRPGYWPKNKDNFAPRLAVVWSPNPKTSIRAGAGMYFDHYGEALTSALSSEASYGLSNSISNPAGVYSYTASSKFKAAPRFTSASAVPSIPLPTADPTVTFPYLEPVGTFGINFGVDSHLKTPYSEAFNLSFQRELPGGFLFEEAYVGRLGRHLLQQLDLAEPVNFNDPQGGGDYFTAAKQLSHAVDAHGGAYGDYPLDPNNPNSALAPHVPIPKIQYFEDVFPQMINYDGQGESATEAVYNYEWAPYRYSEGETTSLADIDFYCGYGGYCEDGTSKFWQSQFSSLYAWSTIGTSSYHALQATLRHPTSRGVSVDVSYTFSKSLDMNSGTERGNEFSTDNAGGSAIQNSWNPKLNKAVSDFDARHLVNGDLVYVLPVGRGRKFLGNGNRLVDGFIGGWTYAGLARWTSGLPFSLFAPGWATNWQLEGYGVTTAPVKTRKHYDYPTKSEQAFDNPSAINAGVETANGPVRLPYPGEAGQRNVFRGDGYFDIDSTLTKVWGIGDFGKLKFDGEVYNVTNTNRFDTSSIASGLTGGSLGAYGTTLPSQGNFRRMQFGLRFDF
jgi:Carboxypeptidase regulatory-like domain